MMRPRFETSDQLRRFREIREVLEVPGRVTVRAKRAVAREWVGLHEASEQLGISATTLRRWADAGMIRTFVTPGGHRRFSRDAIAALLPASGQRPTMDRLGETPARMQRVYRRAISAPSAPIPWVDSLDAEQRALFRSHGVAIVTSLLAALDAPDDAARTARLEGAMDAASAYGSAAAAAGLPASVAVEVFLHFRRPFLGELSELGRRRGLDTTAATELLDHATDAFDDLLVETVRSLERTLAGLRRQRRTEREAAREAARSVMPIPPAEPEGAVAG